MHVKAKPVSVRVEPSFVRGNGYVVIRTEATEIILKQSELEAMLAKLNEPRDTAPLCCWCDEHATTTVKYAETDHLCCSRHAG
jgi:hypothetical protein